MAKSKVKPENKKSLWKKLFPGFVNPEEENAPVESMPMTTGGDADWLLPTQTDETATTTTGDDDALALGVFPKSRLAQYAIFDVMANDPTIDSALKMHISHALSAKSSTGEIISIESAVDEDDPITIDLRDTFKEMINRDCHAWAYNAAKYGCAFARVYGAPKTGVKMLRSDYYTHPRFSMMYERAGQLVGFTSAYQGANTAGIQLMEPWKYIAFRVPYWSMNSATEPIRYEQTPFDIASDDYENEGLVEAQNYGQSLIATAFSPWLDLLDAIQSLNMSRKNAARLERLVGVNTGKLTPQKAALYLNTVAKQLQKTEKRKAADSFRRGYIQTAINRLIPIWGDGKGRLEISTVEGNPNIEALSDIEFHINRLGSAIGVDPALLGFGEQLAGGLGDGGFFRLSILAAIKANLLRKAIQSGLERLFDIHVAYKYGKAFLPGQKPWRIVFNSVSSAIEREEAENRETRANFAMLVGQLIQTIDPEMQSFDPKALNNWIYTDLLEMDEEKFKLVFNKTVKPTNNEVGENGTADQMQF